MNWWDDPAAFAGLSPAGRAIVKDCRYLGGWRPKEKSPGDAVEFAQLGVVYGYWGFKPKFVIPWEGVKGLTLRGPDGETRAGLSAGTRTDAVASYLGGGLIGLAVAANAKVRVCNITVETDQGRARFRATTVLAADLADRLRPILDRVNASPVPAAEFPPRPISAPDGPALLRNLAELRDQGILTEDEFQAKKAEILGRL